MQHRRRPTTHRLVSMLGACVLLVSGCSAFAPGSADQTDEAGAGSRTGDTTTAPAPPTSSAVMPPAPNGLRRFYRQQVSWKPCSAGFECARVQVPLDYDRPGGDRIGLAVSRRPADQPEQRVGALLVNPGGPGVSGISYAPIAVGQLRSDVLDRFDVVGFNPRGVATSEGVDCLDDDELDAFVALDPTPDDPAAVTEAVRLLADFGRGCVEGSGELAGHVSTPEAARDMDVIRAVLASPKLHYYGASYGTLLGATYADLFPTRVGRMVLDGAVDPSLDPMTRSLQQVKGFQRALDAYLAHCVQQRSCPLGQTEPEAERGLRGLLADIDADPLPAGARELTVGHAVLGTWLPLYVPELWPTLDAALAGAVDGDGSGLMRLADLYVSRGPAGYQDNSIEALYAVNCLDEPEVSSAADVRAVLPRFVRASPVFGEVFAWGLLGCQGWPVRAAEPIPQIDAPGAPPIVVVGTTGDPATPYGWAVALADQLRSGVLVTREGEGHTAFGRGNDCIDRAVNDFLAAGDVPEDGLRCS